MGRIVTGAALVNCSHGGLATPTQQSTRVTINGTPIMTVTAAPAYAVACPQGTAPCVSAQWIVGAGHVSSGGLPVAVSDGTALTQPPGQLQVQFDQLRVEAA